MARLIQKPKEEYLQYLRIQMNKKFGTSIASANDCDTLANDIFSSTQHRLSNDTLRRLFNLKKSNSFPSHFTLDVCAKYLEHSDWESLVQAFIEQSALFQRALLFDVIEERIPLDKLLIRINSDIKSTDLYENFNKIILFKAQIKDESFFSHIFEFTNIFEFQELYKYDLYYTHHLLGSLCNKYEWLGKIAVSNYHTETNFVEWLVVPHYKYYLPLLENYYNSNKSTKSVAVFYNLIQGTLKAEKNNWEAFEAHFEELITLVINAYSFNNILKMRWYGIQLILDLHFNQGQLVPNIYNRILNSTQINDSDSGDRITALLVIATYLTKLEMHDKVIELYEKKAIKHSTLLGHWGELNLNQLKVCYTLALLRTDRIEEAKLMSNKIKPHQFDLNFKEQMWTLYETITNEVN